MAPQLGAALDGSGGEGGRVTGLVVVTKYF